MSMPATFWLGRNNPARALSLLEVLRRLMLLTSVTKATRLANNADQPSFHADWSAPRIWLSQVSV